MSKTRTTQIFTINVNEFANRLGAMDDETYKDFMRGMEHISNTQASTSDNTSIWHFKLTQENYDKYIKTKSSFSYRNWRESVINFITNLSFSHFWIKIKSFANLRYKKPQNIIVHVDTEKISPDSLEIINKYIDYKNPIHKEYIKKKLDIQSLIQTPQPPSSGKFNEKPSPKTGPFSKEVSNHTAKPPSAPKTGPRIKKKRSRSIP